MTPSNGALKEREIRQLHRIQMVLWVAFLSPPLLYYGVALFLTQAGAAPRQANPGAAATLAPILYATSLALLAASFLLRRRLLSRRFPSPMAAAQGLLTARIVGWALLEAIAILGLVLVILGLRMEPAIPLIVATLIGVALQRPRRSELEDRLRGSAGP